MIGAMGWQCISPALIAGIAHLRSVIDKENHIFLQANTCPQPWKTAGNGTTKRARDSMGKEGATSKLPQMARPARKRDSARHEANLHTPQITSNWE